MTEIVFINRKEIQNYRELGPAIFCLRFYPSFKYFDYTIIQTTNFIEFVKSIPGGYDVLTITRYDGDYSFMFYFHRREFLENKSPPKMYTRIEFKDDPEVCMKEFMFFQYIMEKKRKPEKRYQDFLFLFDGSIKAYWISSLDNIHFTVTRNQNAI